MPTNLVLPFPVDPDLPPAVATVTVAGPAAVPGPPPVPAAVWPGGLPASVGLPAGTTYAVQPAVALRTAPLLLETVVRVGVTGVVLRADGWLRVAVSTSGAGTAWAVTGDLGGRTVEASSPTDPALVPGRWVRLQVLVDVDQLVLLVGGVVQARLPLAEDLAVPASVAVVRIGHDDALHELGTGVLRLLDGVPQQDVLDAVVAAEAAGVGEVGGAFHRVGKQVLGGEQSAEVAVPGGRHQQFEAGSAYWTPGSGGVVLDGPVEERYRQLGAHAGPLGLPLTDTRAGTARYAGRTRAATPTVPGDPSRMARFEHGVIAWSEETGAHEVRGAVAAHWLLLGGPTSTVGLPTGPPTETRYGYRHPFQYGDILQSWHAGPVAVHESVLPAYERLGGWSGPLGVPLAEEVDVVDDGGRSTGARVQTFEHGLVVRNPAAEHVAVVEPWYTVYREHGGPSGPLGLPVGEPTPVGGLGVTHLAFEHGLMVSHPTVGTVVVGDIDVTLAQAYAASIDDGLYWDLSHDRSAELFSFVTVERDGVPVDGWKERRFPDAGHAGKTLSYGNALVRIPVEASTTITLTFASRDWDDHSHSEALGGITRSYGIDTLWGQLGPTGPSYKETGSGGDGDVEYSYAIGLPTPPLSPDFREDRWWPFVNKGTDHVSYPRYAEAFEDVEPQGGVWDGATNLLDEMFYALAIEGVAEDGNCYGMSSLALRAIDSLNRFRLPLKWYGTAGQKVDDAAFPWQLRDDLNVGQCRQLNGAVVGHVLPKLASAFGGGGVNLGSMFAYGLVHDLLAAGDLVVISFLKGDLSGGHAVLAYGTVPRAGHPDTILVADPNVPYAAAPAALSSRVEVDTDGQWRFVDRGVVHADYASSHGALMIDIPGSVVRQPSVTPMAALALGVESILSSFVIVGGEVRAERIGGFGGAANVTRLPLLQGRSSVQAYAASGPVPSALQTVLVARGHGEVSLYARSAMVTAGAQLSLDEDGVTAFVTVERFAGTRPTLVTDVGNHRTSARLHLASAGGAAGRAGWSATASVTVGGGEPTRLGIASTGAGLLLQGLADGPPPIVELHAPGGPSVFELAGLPPGRSMELRPADMASPFGAQVVRGLGEELLVVPLP